MGTSQQLKQAVDQGMASQPGGCKACQRKGLPLLPLRRVVAPAIGAKLPEDKLTGVNWQDDTVRTLRAGYLYVLLDDTIWLAYQVTPEGCLRQFNPFEPPQGDIQPLTQACIKENHDVPASFINIDMGPDRDKPKYKKAHIAFANDAWPRSVLDAYKNSKAPDPRFTIYDLVKLRDNPAEAANASALTQADDLRKKVWEYAPTSTDFLSVHGFHSRAHRADTMATWAQNASKLHKLPHGIPVLLLPDPIGMVQEYNALRMRLFQAKQQWMASNDQPFQLFTSQALLGIKQLEAQWSAAEAATEAKEAHRAWNANPVLADKAYYPDYAVPLETQRLKNAKTKDQHERLEERYDEASRKAFQDRYDQGLAAQQAKLDTLALRYEHHFNANPFQHAAQHDYANTHAQKKALVDDTASALACLRMTAGCLAGGPTGALPQEGKPLEATQRLWKKLLENKSSLLYKALLARDQNLLQLIQGDLSGDNKGKLYDTINTLIGSTQGQAAMVTPVKAAVGQLLSAAASAANALAKHLQPATQALVGHLHSVAFLRYSGQRITETLVQLSVGEYLTMLGSALHEKADDLLAQLNHTVTQPAARHVRAMVLSGALTIATAKNNTTLITVTVWVLDSIEGVQHTARELGQQVRANAQKGLRLLSIGTATLEQEAANTVRQALQMGASEARQFAAGAMRNLRRAGIAGKRVGSAAPDLLLSMGSLWFQQDSLRKNIDAIAKAPGAGHNEAIASAWSSSIGVLGAGATLIGGAHKALYPGRTITTTVVSRGGLGIESTVITAGERMMQFGGAISAVTGVIDGVGYAWAAERVGAQGDGGAANAYKWASGFSAISASFGIWAAFAEATLLGPLGIALILGLVAYGIAMYAKSLESTPLELWARHTLWGKGLPAERRWMTGTQHDTAIAALNAAALGLTAEAGIHLSPRVVGGLQQLGPMGAIGDTSGEQVTLGQALQYAIALPGYDAAASRYQWSLVVTRHNGTQCIASGANHERSVSVQPPPRYPDYTLGTATPKTELADGVFHITGHIELIYRHDIIGYTLEVSYWPDKSDEDGMAKLTVIENQLDQSKAN